MTLIDAAFGHLPGGRAHQERHCTVVRLPDPSAADVLCAGAVTEIQEEWGGCQEGGEFGFSRGREMMDVKVGSCAVNGAAKVASVEGRPDEGLRM